MRFSLRAAATATAAFSCFAAAAYASQGDAPAAPLFTQHVAAAVTAGDLGLDTIEPVLPETAETALPVPAPTPVPAPAAEEAEEVEGTRSLSELVADYSSAEAGDAETDCLARAVYYESKGEPLVGQLSVAEVVINRARSGRFPSTLCGVVRQPSQFSFVRRGHIPTPPRASRDWRTAVAIARIAQEDLADGQAPRALFFHARRVNPRWRLTRVATVGNHVFYR